jgi:hypothetical protein
MTGQQASRPSSAEAAGPALSDRSVRVRSADLAWRQAGDEVVVLDLAASVFHALNASGALLWERLADWTTAGELARELVGRYRLSAAVAAPDVARFLQACADAGLLEIRPEG